MAPLAYGVYLHGHRVPREWAASQWVGSPVLGMNHGADYVLWEVESLAHNAGLKAVLRNSEQVAAHLKYSQSMQAEGSLNRVHVGHVVVDIHKVCVHSWNIETAVQWDS